MKPSLNIKARARARRYAMQALYSWMMSGNDVATVAAQYFDDRNTNKFDTTYFQTLLNGTIEQLTHLDTCIAAQSTRPFKDIDPISLAILRIASFELLHQPELDYKIPINEALELAKMFGSEDSYKFINGILEMIRKPQA
jgi:N utilization substance protein B